MEEDIKFIKYYMKQYFYEDISIEDDFKFEKAIENLLNRLNFLETGIKELIEKDFKAVFENNGELPSYFTQMPLVKYVKVEKLEKLLKGE